MQADTRQVASSERQGWGASLTLAVTGALGFLALSGVAIWLLPFGLSPVGRSRR
jgi:hypothetical protein